ncbi:type II toxin-antitoxin system RelE/ParE family toxin [Sandarakinorhabdus sp.]|uniref:type II toxin-antitoxin system RelE/ParE family toxin n=1 Tax=Sandarakinorhabdus sp. TaxID=1916663 RepID=UPI003F710557
MAEYRLTPAAQQDLDDIFEHSVSLWGLATALRYTENLQAAFAMLAGAPQRARSCEAIRPGYRRLGVGGHVIFFKATSYGIAVIRILHQRMDASRHL